MSTKPKQTKKTKYLDPKNDITFRKIFGEHPHLLISFLNSLLPLEEDRFIENITYKDGEIIPELPGFKRSIVDVHCVDNYGRFFIVEMQMYWTKSFEQRMLFNAGKAYVRQLKSGNKYKELKPVYGLSLVDDTFHTSKELKHTYYHHYKMVHTQVSNEQIKGLELIFVELPKFIAQNYEEKRLQVLWLRFLTEISEDTQEVSKDLLGNKTIREALEYVHRDAFTEEELKSYDEYWDAVRIEKAAIEELKQKNKQLQKEKEEAQKREQEAQKREQEALQKNIESAKEFLKLNIPVEKITQITGLTKEQIEKLKRKHNL
jgi:predicted transposase/invertase (TIGR01784 family)